MEPTPQTPTQQATFAVEPDATTQPVEKKNQQIVAVEVMNGIVFAVVLILFGVVWGTFAAQTFAAGF